MSVVIDKFSGNNYFLSNFYPSIISYRNYTFKTVDHAYQAMKFSSSEIWSIFAHDVETPVAAKKISKNLTGKVDNWDDIKDDIMYKLLRLKFSPFNRLNNNLWQKLMATEDAVLIEGNDWGDVYWGVCDGGGDNRLGILLMDIRASLQESKWFWEPYK